MYKLLGILLGMTLFGIIAITATTAAAWMTDRRLGILLVGVWAAIFADAFNSIRKESMKNHG